MSVHRLGGANGTLRCACGKPRWPNSELCPQCWGEQHQGHGTRNSREVVIQERLPKDLWMAVNFASSMIRKGTPFHTGVVRAANYYKVDPSDVQRALAQRSGRNRTGKQQRKATS